MSGSDDIKSIDDLKKYPPDSQKKFYDKFKKLTRELYDLSDKPHLAMQRINNRSRTLRIMQQHAKLIKVDTALEGAYNAILRVAGIDPTSSKYFQSFGVKINKLQHYAPAKTAYAIYSETENYANKEVRNLNGRVIKMFHDFAEKHTELEYIGLDNVETLNKLLPFYDDMVYNKEVTEAGKTESEALLSFARNHQINLKPNKIELVQEALKELRDGFNFINYGEIDLEGKTNTELMKNAKPGTLLHFMSSLKDRMNIIRINKSYYLNQR